MRKFLDVLIMYQVIAAAASLAVAYDEAVSSHCTQQERKHLDTTPRKIIPTRIDVSGIPEPQGEVHHINVSLCPDSRFIKISWSINSSQGHDMDLCYRLKSIRNGELLATHCFRFSIVQSQYTSSMDCWFPMESLSKIPVISAWVTSSLDNTKLFYGDLNTSGLDPRNSCSDVCEVTLMVIEGQITCHKNAGLVYARGVSVQHLTFNASDVGTCTEDSLNISNKRDNRTDYVLNCKHNGRGQIKVLYSINGRICLKHQDVRVFCSEGSSSASVTHVTQVPPGQSFETFVIFGVVCMVVITTAVVVIIFVVQRIPAVKRRCSNVHSRRHHHYHNNHNDRVEGLPLHSSNSAPLVHTSSPAMEHSDGPLEEVIVNHYKHRMGRMDSVSSNSSKNNIPPSKVKTIQQLHRSATMAILENMEGSYRKKILFLPTPFDIFSRDATVLLKTVFMLDADVPSQSCFDRDICSQYLSGNRNNWIAQLLADTDRILIFLCFTSIGVESKRDTSMVEEVLAHLLLTKRRPRCKVIFLHIMDSTDNLDISHHGDTFHLNHSESYTDFISEVLKFSGRSSESHPDLFKNVTNSLASQQFLKHIGISNKSPLSS